MADTLAEIYRATLTASDFDSNGEATIVTTNSSTSHVFRGVQVNDADTDIPVGGTIQANGFDVVALTGNSSGTEIIAPSSTVKVKASGFPLRYEDRVFAVRTSGSYYGALSEPFVNDVAGKSPTVTSTNNPFGFSMTGSSNYTEWQPNLGPSNNVLLIYNDWNSTTGLVLYNSSGTQLYTHTTAYTPKWFDGDRYAYWYNEGNPYGIHRLDTWTNTLLNLVPGNYGGVSTYGRMMGIKDEFLIFWSEQTSTIKRMDFATLSVSTVGSNNANAFFNQMSAPMFLVKKSDNSITMVQRTGTDNFRIYENMNFRGNGLSSSGINSGYGDCNLDSGANLTFTAEGRTPVIGSKIYFIQTADNDGINYIGILDLDNSDRSGQGAFSLKAFSGTTFPTTYPSNRKCLQTFLAPPSASTISGRTYSINPSLGLRITGVTTT